MFHILDVTALLALNCEMRFFKLFSSVLILALTFGCVSVELPQSKVIPSKSLKFVAPAQPFLELTIADVQFAWKSTSTANIITLQSDCSPEGDMTLESMEAEAKSAFDRASTVTTKDFFFLERRARRTSVEGDMDGVRLAMEIFVFKKDGCRYKITFSGRSTPSEMAIFDKFISGLEIQ